jgi:hypothetical protein
VLTGNIPAEMFAAPIPSNTLASRNIGNTE